MLWLPQRVEGTPENAPLPGERDCPVAATRAHRRVHRLRHRVPHSDGSSRAPELTTGFDLPEAAEWDPETAVWFVSNMVGNPAARDHNGWIGRLDPSRPDRVDTLAAGGQLGVTLHGPKGMVVHGDVVWVTDIDALRAFDKRTGVPRGTIEMAAHGAVALNDIALHPDGSISVTDPRLLFGDDGSSRHEGEDRIFRVAPDGAVSVAVQGPALAQPNGIAWDAAADRFVIAPLEGTTVLGWRPGDASPAVIGRAGGAQDGVAVLDSGEILVSSLADGSIYLLKGHEARPLITGLRFPVSFGMDRDGCRIAIPLIGEGRVEIWDITPRRAAQTARGGKQELSTCVPAHP